MRSHTYLNCPHKLIFLRNYFYVYALTTECRAHDLPLRFKGYIMITSKIHTLALDFYEINGNCMVQVKRLNFVLHFIFWWYNAYLSSLYAYSGIEEIRFCALLVVLLLDLVKRDKNLFISNASHSSLIGNSNT